MIHALDRFGVFGEPARGLRETFRRDHDTWFTHAERLNLALHDLIPQVKPHQFVRQELLVAVLFLRALTQYQATLILAQYGLPDECKIILRSLIELVIYLQAAHKDKNLAEEYVRQHDRERIKILKLIERSDTLQAHMHITSIDAKTDREKILRSLGDKREDLKLETYAEVAGLLPVYHTAYKVLCGTVHTGVQDLQRHFNSETPEKLTELHYGMSDESLDHILFVATEMMLHAANAVRERFDIPETNEMQSIVERHKELGDQEAQQQNSADEGKARGA